MKKIILTVLILLTILIASCNDTVEQESKVPIEIIESTSITLPITPYVVGARYRGDYVKQWEQYMKGNYNIEIDMIPIEVYASTYSQNMQIEFKDVWPGLILVQNQALVGNEFILEDLIDENQILPLNEFLKNSKMWNTLSEEITNSFTDSNGNIWAIPFDDELNVKARTIRNDWLKELNLKAPDTLDDLYEVMQCMTYDDPDGNQENDTFGDYLTFSQYKVIISQFYDIFEANGIYLTYVNLGDKKPYSISGMGNRVLPFGVNPESGKIENSVNSPYLKETFDYIRLLIDNNLYEFADLHKVRELRKNNNLIDTYGCQLNLVDQYDCDQEKYSYVFALTGAKDKFTSSVVVGGRKAYVLSSNANIEEAMEYIPKFIDTFYGTKEGYILGRYGITGEDYKYSYTDGKIVQNREDVENDTDMQLVGNLSWYEEAINRQVNDDHYLSRSEIFADDRVFMLSPMTTTIANMISNRINDAPLWTETGALMGTKFCYSFTDFILGEVSSDELVEEWQKVCRMHNVDENIAEVNKLWYGQ